MLRQCVEMTGIFFNLKKNLLIASKAPQCSGAPFLPGDDGQAGAEGREDSAVTGGQVEVPIVGHVVALGKGEVEVDMIMRRRKEGKRKSCWMRPLE